MRLRAGFVGVLAVTVLVAAGCGSDDEGGGAAAASSKPLNIAFLSTYAGLPFYTATECGARDAAKELGGDIELSVEGPPHGVNVAEQVPLLSTIVNRKPDGLILVPADPRALVAPAKVAVEKGVALTTTDQTLTEKIDLANYHSDNVAGGRLAGESMLKLLNGKKGTLLPIDNKPGLPHVNDRVKGFVEAVKGAPGITLLPTQYGTDDPNKSAAIVQAAARAHPDLIGVYGATEAVSNGMVAGLKGVSKSQSSQISKIGYDAGPTLARAVSDGELDAIIAQGSYDQGHEAMTTLVKYLRGQLDKADIQYDNTVKTVLVTKDNIDQPDVKKYLYPERCGAAS
jgi:ribose transport system substrate-binding protein